MKKFFAILLTVLTTLVLLPACGGGGDDSGDATVMTGEDWAKGRKCIRLGNGTSTTLYIYPNLNNELVGTKYKATYDETTGNILTEWAMNEGYANICGTQSEADLDFSYYECTYDADGNIVTATMNLNFRFSIPEDNAIIDFFNQAAEEEGGNAQTGDITITLNYATGRWVLGNGEGGVGDDEDPVGSTFLVQPR